MPKCVRNLALALLLGGARVYAADTAAERAFKAAEQAVRSGDSFKAYLLYAQAAQLEPANPLYSERKTALQGSPTLAAETQLASDPAVTPPGTQAPGPDAAKPTEEIVLGNDLADAVSPAQLKGSAEKKNFDLKGSARTVLEGAAAALDIEMIFDSAYQPLPAVTFRAEDYTFQETLRTLERVTDSFFVPLNEKSVMVVRDTPQNRTQYTPTMSLTALIPERMSVQEAQELVTAVQQILEVRRISMDPTKKVVTFRDSVAKAAAARQLFTTLSRSRAQIAVDVEFLSVSKTSSLRYGLNLPTSVNIVDFGKTVGGIVTTPAGAGTLTNLFALGGGALPLGLGIANAAVFATLSKASSQTLLNVEMVSLDGQAASFHVGDRYPVVSATFSGLTPDTNVSSTLAPTVNYVDLGIQVKMTPTVHQGGEVTLDLEAEFKTLGAQGGNGIPAIASRQYQGKVRLKEGEWAVVAGLISVDSAETPTGIAGLVDIPWIGKLLSQQSRSTDSTDVLLVLKPHLLAEPPWEEVSKPIWTGTDTRPASMF